MERMKRRKFLQSLLINFFQVEKEEAPSSTRLCLTPATEGQLLLWIPEGIKSSPHLSLDDDHSDDTNHSGGGC